MSSAKALNADDSVPPKMDQKIVSIKVRGIKDCLGALSIGLAAYLIGWLLEIDEYFGSGVIDATGCIGAARFVTLEFSKEESIIKITTLGLFSQVVCHHSEMGFAICTSNGLITCYSVYLASRNGSAKAESPAKQSHIVKNRPDKDPSELVIANSEVSGSKQTELWSVVTGLIIIATIVSYLFTNQPPTNNCIVFTRKIDSTRWQTVVRAEISCKGCDFPTQMSLTAYEIRAYTREIDAEA
jgi:hypothetical protein